MVQPDDQATQKKTEQLTTYSIQPPITTTDKHSTLLNSRTLRDISQLLDPYEMNFSDAPITTLTSIKHTNLFMQSTKTLKE